MRFLCFISFSFLKTKWCDFVWACILQDLRSRCSTYLTCLHRCHLLQDAFQPTALYSTRTHSACILTKTGSTSWHIRKTGKHLFVLICLYHKTGKKEASCTFLLNFQLVEKVCSQVHYFKTSNWEKYLEYGAKNGKSSEFFFFFWKEPWQVWY